MRLPLILALVMPTAHSIQFSIITWHPRACSLSPQIAFTFSLIVPVHRKYSVSVQQKMSLMQHRYAHILSYLRSPVSTPENPAMLPRAAQLTSSSSSRLEALLELRDEARYLDLDELYKLCTEEIRQRQGVGTSSGLGLHLRGFSNGSNSSARSLHTQRDETESNAKARRMRRDSNDSGFASTRKGAGSVVSEVEPHTPQAPIVQHRILRGRSQVRKDGTSSLRSRPTGEWI